MIPEVRACSGYLVITPKRAYRDNARALMTPQEVMPVMRCHPYTAAKSAPNIPGTNVLASYCW